MLISGFVKSMGDKIPRLSQNGFDESRISSDRFDIFVSRDIVGVDRLDLLSRKTRVSGRRMLLLQLSEDIS
jgi:hypothetical protein